MERTNITRKGDCGVRTKELIARYYLTLMGEFRNEDNNRLFLSMDRGDMFHNAIALILQDSKFQKMETDEEIMKNIRRRIRNVILEITQDDKIKKEKTIDYANNIQAKEEQAG